MARLSTSRSSVNILPTHQGLRELTSIQFHDRFVKKLEWVNDEVYQELFSVCQAFSGPASTKMLSCINLLYGWFVAALLSFVLWW